MNDWNEQSIGELVRTQRDFFLAGETRKVGFRVEQLQRLKALVLKHEQGILDALRQDLGKNPFEAYVTEIGFVLSEIEYILRQLRSWVRPRRKRIPLWLLPGSAWVEAEPYGVSLIIGPWNYPFQLIIAPLVGAIAAGNTAVLKPSEHSAHTSRLLSELMGESFSSHYIACVEGGIPQAQALLKTPFDFIFYTGNTTVGRLVMEQAAKRLTPVVLELGGKNPCFVDRDIPLSATARRIVLGKFLNAGQTCIAPDYLVVDRAIKDDLIQALVGTIRSFYGEDPARSAQYGRIINTRHVDRLAALLSGEENLLCGGEIEREERYLAPTLVDRIGWDHRLMQEEIFGPILPILSYEDLEGAIAQVRQRPHPLSLYVFSRNKRYQRRILGRIQSGGACVNDCVLQVVPKTLPFGGIGESGMGSYHGAWSFHTFSHSRAVLQKSFSFDSALRYPPFPPLRGFLKRIFK